MQTKQLPLVIVASEENSTSKFTNKTIIGRLFEQRQPHTKTCIGSKQTHEY